MILWGCKYSYDTFSETLQGKYFISHTLNSNSCSPFCKYRMPDGQFDRKNRRLVRLQSMSTVVKNYQEFGTAPCLAITNSQLILRTEIIAWMQANSRIWRTFQPHEKSLSSPIVESSFNLMFTNIIYFMKVHCAFNWKQFLHYLLFFSKNKLPWFTVQWTL